MNGQTPISVPIWLVTLIAGLASIAAAVGGWSVSTLIGIETGLARVSAVQQTVIERLDKVSNSSDRFLQEHLALQVEVKSLSEEIHRLEQQPPRR